MTQSTSVLGIDLGTSGVRIAILGIKSDLLYSSDMLYPKGIEYCEDWSFCCKKLLQDISQYYKQHVTYAN